MLGLLVFVSTVVVLVNGELTEHNMYTREDASGEGQCSWYIAIASLWVDQKHRHALAIRTIVWPIQP